MLENRAAGGTAIIMNPHTGEILAMANEPTFNPNAFRDFDDDDRRNRAVQDLYEPGSTFKVVTASAAIEEKLMPIDAMIDVSGGQIRIDKGRVVHDTHNYGVLSFTDVIVKSSNVGAIKIGFRLGQERLERLRRALRLRPRRCRRIFPARAPGIVWRADKWTDSALASVSMGYQVGVTPLQMARRGELGCQRRQVHRAARGSRRHTRTTAAMPSSRRSSARRSAPTPRRR